MKKNNIFKMLVFTIMLFLIGVFNVKADFTIDFSNSDNRQTISHIIGVNGPSIKSHYRIDKKGNIVYCYQPYVAYAVTDSSFTGELIYNNCSTVTTNSTELSYIFTNGYGGTNDYATGGTKFEDYYATQLAVWYFGHRSNYSDSGYSRDYFEDFQKGSNGKITYIGSESDNITTKAAELINAAIASVNASSSISLDTSNTKLVINSDRSYYVSGAIKINGSWVRDSVTVSISGVTGAFVTSDANATSGSTDFKVGDTIYVKVPAGNITKSSSVSLSVTGTSKKGTGTVSVCFNDPSTGSQKLVNTTNGTPTLVNRKLTLTAEPSKVEVKISKQDITGSKEVKGATLVIKKGNTEVTKWVSEGTIKKISLDAGTYTLEETIAPAGYKLSSSKVTFTVNSNGTVTVDGKVVDKVIMKNEPFYVTISKLGLTKDKELVGAKLKITDKDGKLTIDLDGKSLEWITTESAEKFHLADGTYYLTEIEAPAGYIKSDKTIEFIVEKNGTIKVNKTEVTKVTMENEPLYIYISKKSINGKTELPGAKLKITDKDGKLEKDLDGKSLIWTSSTKEERFRLAPGSYILTELEAPKGYELSDAVIEFTVTEDGRILFDKKEAENNMIVFKNTPEPEQVVTGSSLIYILFVGIITAGVVTFFVLKRND
ncbi:MAG: SpaA isopeptide-forming pilin-related protein [Bacilli bacterium]|nr:SpaA isopeptide-forming pilin-related protein [Bacilli bacterium]